MHLTLLESHRSFFQAAECALVSILAHAGLVWLAGMSILRLWRHKDFAILFFCA